MDKNSFLTKALKSWRLYYWILVALITLYLALSFGGLLAFLVILVFDPALAILIVSPLPIYLLIELIIIILKKKKTVFRSKSFWILLFFVIALIVFLAYAYNDFANMNLPI